MNVNAVTNEKWNNELLIYRICDYIFKFSDIYKNKHRIYGKKS
jgi:hypothetical protein